MLPIYKFYLQLFNCPTFNKICIYLVTQRPMIKFRTKYIIKYSKMYNFIFNVFSIYVCKSNWRWDKKKYSKYKYLLRDCSWSNLLWLQQQFLHRNDRCDCDHTLSWVGDMGTHCICTHLLQSLHWIVSFWHWVLHWRQGYDPAILTFWKTEFKWYIK